MSEKLNNNAEQVGRSRVKSEWDTLAEVPFKGATKLGETPSFEQVLTENGGARIVQGEQERAKVTGTSKDGIQREPVVSGTNKDDGAQLKPRDGMGFSDGHGGLIDHTPATDAGAAGMLTRHEE